MAKVATKSTKTATKTKNTKKQTRTSKPTTVSNEIKPFVFRLAEVKHIGEEPSWAEQPRPSVRISTMAHSFSWYRYFFTNKEAKEMMLQWLRINGRDKDAKVLKNIPDEQYPLTQCWLARMNAMGLVLLENESDALNTAVENLKALVAPSPTTTDDKKVTIQDRLADKAKDAASAIEAMYDAFLLNGAKMTADIKPINVLRSMNVSPQHTGLIVDEWTRDLNDFKAAQAGTDEYIAESYSGYTKIQLRNLIKFAEQVIADCGSYTQVKKAERKPRAKKAVSPEKIAMNFKFMKEVPALKLKSESPAKLVAAQEAWLYDTAKRKIIHVVADANAGSLTIKRSSVVGFDAASTVQKTVRKPEELIAKFVKEGKPALRKVFKDIKATETKWTGRSSENLVILRVW
jgi:hypothetical protein